MRCDRCQKDVPAETLVEQGSQKVCEDCLMDLLSPAKACDPWAVRHAKSSLGSDPVAALQGVERRLYDLVKKRGRVPRDEVPKLLGVSPAEAQRALATLRHMELVRADKGSGGRVDLVLFQEPHRADGAG